VLLKRRWSIGGMTPTRRNKNTRTKPLSIVSSSATNLASIGPGSKLGLRGERQATNYPFSPHNPTNSNSNSIYKSFAYLKLLVTFFAPVPFVTLDTFKQTVLLNPVLPSCLHISSLHISRETDGQTCCYAAFLNNCIFR
jgi:hypothetical protein